MKAYFCCIIIFVRCNLMTQAASRDCSPEDFHYEYTECDSLSGRWKVAIPNDQGTCMGNTPMAVRGKQCAFTCEAGQYLDISDQQECRPCPPGTYSLGGGLRFDDWGTLPSGFAVRKESFAGSKLSQALTSLKYKFDANCTKAGWIPKGSYIASLAGGCSASLSFSVTLVKPGEVRFIYQHTDEDALFQFMVQNNECQTVSDKDSSRWPSVTGEGEWKTIAVELKSGLNLLHWKTMGVSNDESTLKKPIRIKKIEISGVAYTSECTKCKNGTYSNDPTGAAACMPCPPNLFSQRGAKVCRPCPARQYSVPGSAECLDRPPCAEKDYFEYNSPCDSKNKTQVMYKWIDPKVCVGNDPRSKELPASGLWKVCPPCNPGMEFYNGTCRFCKNDMYSDGIQPCSKCTASTAPIRELVYTWWNSLPEEANVTSACLSVGDQGCVSKEGWAKGLEYIHSRKGHTDDAYLVLSLTVGGFAGGEDPHRDKSNPVGNISFVFELECSADCSFFFMMQTASSGTTVIEDWSGNQEKQQYTYALTSTEDVTFTWAYQKLDVDSIHAAPDGPSYKLINDMAKIYSVNVSNTLYGGASRCRLCPQGANLEGCIPCPGGSYIDPNTTRCMPCPAHTVVHGSNPWGANSCKPCGEGLTAQNHAKCVSDGHYVSQAGMHYDLTSLTGLKSTTGSRLFTASGTQYFHYFNISLLGNGDQFPLTKCHDNITYFDKTKNATTKPKDMTQEVVTSVLCRVTLIPPRLGEQLGTMAAQPVSLGNVLVNITTNGESLNIGKRMKENGFSTEGSEMDVHFTYVSELPTSACRLGRSSIITLRCDVSQKGTGEIQLPPRCPDGTCDGCNFHFLWLSRAGCPSCKREDYEVVNGECVHGIQAIHYIPPKHCIELGEMKKVAQRPCSVLPFWLEVVICICVGIGIMMIVLLMYCWKRNRKLEYKYSKLQENKEGREGELPGADSCGLDEEDDDDHYDSVAFKESKGKQLFKKIKFMAKKDADNPFENIRLTNKDNLLT